MDNITQIHSEHEPIDTDVSETIRFRSDPPSVSSNGVWDPDAHHETYIERSLRQELHRIHIVWGSLIIVCASILLLIISTIYRNLTYVDPVKPDYTALDTESENYWSDRIKIDITTAAQSKGTNLQRALRLRRFALRTVGDAFRIPSSFVKAQAITGIVIILAQNDVDIVLDDQLAQLGDTSLIAAMRNRAVISRALMNVRLGKKTAAKIAVQQYNRLAVEADLKLNSPTNEESFFGAVTVLKLLDDNRALAELFSREIDFTLTVGIDQRMRAYRLIVGEQVRAGKVLEALETSRRINNPVELARAWELMLAYAARPPRIEPVEPAVFDLPEEPPTGVLPYPFFAARVAERIFQLLAETKDLDFQISMLQRIAGSRLMYDAELHKVFRQSVQKSDVFDTQIKRQIFKLLDDPDSPTIRTALGMPPRPHSAEFQSDSAVDDWSSSDETIHVETIEVDSAPIRTHTDQQFIQIYLAVAQSYQSVGRFRDADRVLKKTFVAVQKFADSNVRTQLLMRIGEQQIVSGSIADVQKTFAALSSSDLNQDQKAEIARLQIIARLFNDAMKTIASIETPVIRDEVCRFFLQEQIQIHHLDEAAQSLALMSDSPAAAECRSRLKIAQKQGSKEDFALLGLSFPLELANNQEREQCCIELIRSGFLMLAGQTAIQITEPKKRADILRRIGGEYLLIYNAYNEMNDPKRQIRQKMEQIIWTAAEQIGQANAQTNMMMKLLNNLTERLQTEEDVTAGKKIWTQVLDVCRKIAESDDRAVLFAQLIAAKNLLEKPLRKTTLPFFTKESNEAAYIESNQLVTECLEMVNGMKTPQSQGTACTYLAKVLAQIGRTKSAQTILNRVEEIADEFSSSKEVVPMRLLMVPTLKAMNSTGEIPKIYRSAIDAVSNGFTGILSHVDVYDWRIRDSEVERIIRSQMESGFVDDAVKSVNRLNEPVLRDRLLRAAAYIYLDQGDMEQAEIQSRRLTVKEIQRGTIQNVLFVKRRSERQALLNDK